MKKKICEVINEFCASLSTKKELFPSNLIVCVCFYDYKFLYKSDKHPNYEYNRQDYHKICVGNLTIFKHKNLFIKFNFGVEKFFFTAEKK